MGEKTRVCLRGRLGQWDRIKTGEIGAGKFTLLRDGRWKIV